MDDSRGRPGLIDQPHQTPRKQRLRFLSPGRLLALAVTVLALAVLAWFLTPSSTSTASPSGRSGNANAPMPIAAAPAQQGDMPIVINALGTVTPVTTVTVKTQINGQITQFGFKEGQTVKQGDFIAQIDPRPYQVALEQANGTLAKDQALLANAKIDLGRYKTLVAQDSIAEQTLATQAALVRQYEGTVKNDEGAVDAAKLNLVYCHITAPAAGRIGLRQVDLGNYVTPGDANGIVVITQLHPMTVIFTVPEDQLPALMKHVHAGETLKVSAYDRSHTTLIETGALETVDNQIDTSTGTVKLRAVFQNTEESLFANQFVNIDLLLDTQHNAILVPPSAVQRGAPGTFVYTVDRDDNTAHVQVVTLGPTSADAVAITKGLSVGDLVVTDGTDRLKDGAKITIPDPSTTATTPAGGQRRHRRKDAANGDAGTAAPATGTPAPDRGQAQ